MVGSTTAARPAAPLGSRPSQPMFTLAYSLGLLSWIDRMAEIASWIQTATPEARYRLSETLSQESTSEVIPSSYNALLNLIASRSSLESQVEIGRASCREG